MFFLGGFNTALPYLLYISLIWIFMIIGLSGKHNILPAGKNTEQGINAYHTSVTPCDNNLFDAAEVQETADSIINNEAISIYCLYLTSLPPDPIGYCTSRGPPVARG